MKKRITKKEFEVLLGCGLHDRLFCGVMDGTSDDIDWWQSCVHGTEHVEASADFFVEEDGDG